MIGDYNSTFTFTIFYLYLKYLLIHFQVIIELNHRSTAAKVGVVDIYLNEVRLNHNVEAPKDKFVSESFLYGGEKFHPYDNTIKIELGENSPGTYFLSDVTIYVKRVPDKTGKRPWWTSVVVIVLVVTGEIVVEK